MLWKASGSAVILPVVAIFRELKLLGHIRRTSGRMF